MYLSFIILPLLGSISSLLLGRKIGRKGSIIITITCLLISNIINIYILGLGIKGNIIIIKIKNWIEIEGIRIKLELLLDNMTLWLSLPVLMVSLMVHIYTIEYMREDPHNQRFYGYLSLFTFFMLILITGNNYIVLLIGWEGIGLASFLLINFWYTSIEANKSAIQAIIVNKIGDWGLTLGIINILLYNESVDYSIILSMSNIGIGKEEIINVITILLLIGAIGKSAQFPLHIWLPNAMAAPTPVSALLHAATLVTAGIYLILRSSLLFELSSTSILMILIGSITTLIGGTIGLYQNDIKKVIAYSTCSQLGYMVLGCGLSNYGVSLYHLFNHAFFKALLFLSAGSVIHAIQDEQDMRKMGGLINILPFTYGMILIGSLSLMGLPYLTGYYSKDYIIELSYSLYILTGQLNISYILGIITALITSIYSIKLIYLTFISYPNAGSKKKYKDTHECSLYIFIPLILLSIASIYIGYITKDIFIGIGTNNWNNILYVHPNNLINMVETELIVSKYIILKLMPTILIFISILIIIIININSRNQDLYLGRNIFILLNKKYWIDNIYTYIFVLPILNLGYFTNKIIDRGILELIGPLGIKNIIIYMGKLDKLETGFILHYILYIITGGIIFILLI